MKNVIKLEPDDYKKRVEFIKSNCTIKLNILDITEEMDNNHNNNNISNNNNNKKIAPRCYHYYDKDSFNLTIRFVFFC